MAVAGFVINLTISRSEQEATKQRAQSEREAAEKRDKTAHELALNNQREDRLQTYLDRMSELLLTSSLRKSELNDGVRNIARARTLTVFSQLDRERKRTVLQFLYEANLISKNITGNILNLEHADLSEGDYSLLTFREANLHQILMWDSNLQLADFRGADISDADLSRCELQNINLSGANLRETYIQNAKLADTDLHNADLSKAHLRSSDLNYANLSGANLSGAHLGSLLNQDKSFYRRAANLTIVNLSNSILIDANLIEVNLTGANLREADLSRANLDKAKVSPEQLNTAKSLKGATMPDGSIHP